jgi:AcrR family transcriptional regulator
MAVSSAERVAGKGVPVKAMGRIMQAAAQEFSRAGVDGARVGNIAQQAGVTKQLVYHYYNNKADLYKAVLEEAAARCVDELLPLNYDHLEPIEALKTFWYRVFDQYASWPELGSSILDENIHRGEHLTARNSHVRQTPLLQEKVAVIIRRGQAAKLFKDNVDPQLFFAASLILITGCFVQGTTVSALLPFDLTTAEGKAFWRTYSVHLILEMLACHGRPIDGTEPAAAPESPGNDEALSGSPLPLVAR